MDLSERLKAARIAAGFASAGEAARRFGWNVGAYRHHENGTSGFKLDRAREYARAFNVSVEWLLFGEGDQTVPAGLAPVTRSIPVVGKVAAGVWREVHEDFQDGPLDIIHLNVPGYERANLFALQIEGPSMNMVYPDGRMIIAAPPAEAGLRDGDYVVVRRNRSGLVETTVKELVKEPTRWALWPRSTDSAFQTPIYLDGDGPDSQDGADIIGVVIADYSKRIRPPASLG